MIIYKCDACGSETTQPEELIQKSDTQTAFLTKLYVDGKGEVTLQVVAYVKGLDELCRSCFLDILDKVVRESR